MGTARPPPPSLALPWHSGRAAGAAAEPHGILTTTTSAALRSHPCRCSKMRHTVALLAVLALLAARPAAAARHLQGLDSSLPGEHPPAGVRPRGGWGAFAKGTLEFFSQAASKVDDFVTTAVKGGATCTAGGAWPCRARMW